MKLSKKYDYDDVLLVPNTSDIMSRSEVNLRRKFKFAWSDVELEGIGIIAANMDTVGTLEMASALDAHGVFTAVHKHYAPDQLKNWFNSEQGQRSFYTMGTSIAEMNKLEQFVSESGAVPRMICIDIANGHSNILLDAIVRVRKAYKNVVIMAGNVVTAERAIHVIGAGADIVKVGIGSGSSCITRKQTGIGYPQLSAVYECALAVEEMGGMVCADGGCTVPGDITKAFVAGADFVMLGGMLAGTVQSGGSIVRHRKVISPSVKVCVGSNPFDTSTTGYIYNHMLFNGLESLPDSAWDYVPIEEPKMLFYGMSSETAMDKYHGGVASYRSSEGRTVLIPYKGDVNQVIFDILGGIRSALSYIGVKELENAAHKATFVEVGKQLNTVFVK